MARHHPQRPYTECPRFDRCGVNHCPLDPEKDKRENLPGEDKCTLGKTYRTRIAARYPELLPWRGLSPRELLGVLRWERMTPAEREAGRAKLAANLGRLASEAPESDLSGAPEDESSGEG